MLANLEFGLSWTFRLFLGSNCTILALSCLIRSSCWAITKSFLSRPFATFLKSILAVAESVVSSPVICRACSRASSLFWGVYYSPNKLSWFYSGTRTSLRVSGVVSSGLLLFLSNSWFIRGFDIRTGHNPKADHLCLQFKAVKASIRASL
jgi:hypothetical protein